MKEGIQKDGKYDYGEDEELHVLITGNTQQDVSDACVCSALGRACEEEPVEVHGRALLTLAEPVR